MSQPINMLTNYVSVQEKNINAFCVIKNTEKQECITQLP